uniref:Uncharacterized protein n=1 Tax=Chenopodium quinoa TaxID=63459 RepID=A0A803NBX8_CHEQI
MAVAREENEATSSSEGGERRNKTAESKPSGTVGHSAPLLSRSSENSAAGKFSLPKIASPLPTPPRIGYYSMPLSGASGTERKSPPSKLHLAQRSRQKQLEEEEKLSKQQVETLNAHYQKLEMVANFLEPI